MCSKRSDIGTLVNSVSSIFVDANLGLVLAEVKKENKELLMSKPLNDFILRRVVMLNSSTPISVAARAMKEQQVESVLVVGADGELEGILSERDIVCEIVANQFSTHGCLARAMTYDVCSLYDTADVEAVLDVMEEHGLRRVPILSSSDRNHCVGIVVLDDLVAAQLVSNERLSNIIKRQLRRKMSKPFKAMQCKMQSDSHNDHMLNRFYKAVSESCHVTKTDAINISEVFLAHFVQSLSASGAAPLIAQLPKALQEQLLRLPAGPNRSINVESLKNILCRTNCYSEKRIETLAVQFWEALMLFLKVDNLDFLSIQISEDFRELFCNKHSSSNVKERHEVQDKI